MKAPDKTLRRVQLRLLEAVPRAAGTFALAGGTALELYYLKHRFSRDLDFFSPRYDLQEIAALVREFSLALGRPVELVGELVLPGRAKVRSYEAAGRGGAPSLKVDFVEDVLLAKPQVVRFKKIPVYGVLDIYFHKISALVGARQIQDQIGRDLPTGRREIRDMVDVYYLSRKITPLHKYLSGLSRSYQRGVIQWYRSYPRREAKLGVLDLAIYDKDFDPAEMIAHFDKQIGLFMKEVLA